MGSGRRLPACSVARLELLGEGLQQTHSCSERPVHVCLAHLSARPSSWKLHWMKRGTDAGLSTRSHPPPSDASKQQAMQASTVGPRWPSGLPGNIHNPPCISSTCIRFSSPAGQPHGGKRGDGTCQCGGRGPQQHCRVVPSRAPQAHSGADEREPHHCNAARKRSERAECIRNDCSFRVRCTVLTLAAAPKITHTSRLRYTTATCCSRLSLELHSPARIR